jgi:hypothetical protein
MRIIRTTNPNGTYRYELDGEVMYKASKVLYTHATSYTVGDENPNSPVLFHKTEAAALRARGYQGWVKTGTQAIEDGDATATVAQHALTIATLAAVLMEQGRLRLSKGLSSGAITTTLDIARGNEATRAAGIALAHGHDSDIREAFKTSVPPAMAPVVDEPAPATVDLWETHQGETHGYDNAGNRVIEISERTRPNAWNGHTSSNRRTWAVLGDGATRHGVLASGTADGLRAAKRAALAAWADIMATPAPLALKVPRVRAKVVANAGPSHLRGRQGRVESKGRGDDGKLYVTVEFEPGVTWPFLVSELTLV